MMDLVHLATKGDLESEGDISVQLPDRKISQVHVRLQMSRVPLSNPITGLMVKPLGVLLLVVPKGDRRKGIATRILQLLREAAAAVGIGAVRVMAVDDPKGGMVPLLQKLNAVKKPFSTNWWLPSV